MAFRKAADTANARIRHDRFDSSIIEVQSSDIYKFVESLQTFII